MRKLLALGAALIASVALYVAVFAVVDRPLTLAGITTAMQLKSNYARSLPSPKIAIWAGSNGRYSHRCEAFTATTGLPCVNLSLAIGIGIDFQLLQYESLLEKGDVLYMPLEYGQYATDRAQMENGAENTLLVHQQRDLLWTLGPRRILRAWGSFDLPFLIQGVLETGLANKGFVRRTGLQTQTPQGDERGHDAASGRAYEPLLAGLQFDTRPVPQNSYSIEILGRFLERMRARGVIAVGGLPTTPNSVKLDSIGIDRVIALFERHGHSFLVLPNRSQYPRSCFYDTLYHLNEACQIAHSTQVGEALAAKLNLSGRLH